MMTGKPLAALIVGKKLPADGKPAYGADPAGGGSGLDIAQDLIDAIHAKDAHATMAALQAYCELHEAGEPDHGEPDGDEAPPPE